MPKAREAAYMLINDFFIRLTDEMISRIENATSEVEIENYVKSLIDHKLGVIR